MKKKVKKVLGFILYLMICFFAGFFGALYFDDLVIESDYFLISILYLFFCIYGSMFLHIMIHECGHLIFGCLTGYSFLSLRIGNLMFLKKDGKIHLKHYSLAGTAGQCLLSPPEYHENMPYLLYHLGGCINNFIFSTLSLIAVNTLDLHSYLNSFLIIFSLIGYGLGLANGIPFKLGKITNDGSNIYELIHYPQSRYAIYLQMKINELTMLGIRAKDMPDELFSMPRVEDWKLPICLGIAVNNEERLLDMGDLESSYQLNCQIVESTSNIPDIYKQLLINNQIFYLLLNNRTDEAKQLITKPYIKMRKAMKKHPSFLRTTYTCHLLLDKDEKQAEKDLKLFEKIAKTYPSPSEVESERELIQMVHEVIL